MHDLFCSLTCFFKLLIKQTQNKQCNANQTNFKLWKSKGKVVLVLLNKLFDLLHVNHLFNQVTGITKVLFILSDYASGSNQAPVFYLIVFLHIVTLHKVIESYTFENCQYSKDH